MHVGKVGSGRNLQYNNRSISDLLADSVIPYVNVLDLLEIDRIASQVDCTLVVFVNWDGFSLRPNSSSSCFINVTSSMQLLRA